MEHIIQFGVTIDDEAIKERITQQAANTVINEVKKELGIDNRYYRDESAIRLLVNNEVTCLFDKYKDDIIKEAGKQLSERLVKTKAVKEATSKVIDNILQEEK